MSIHSSFNQNISFKHLFTNPFKSYKTLEFKNKNLLQEIFNLQDSFHINWYLNARSAFYDVLISLKKENPNKNEVIIPAHTCVVLINPILKAGLKPVFVDTQLKSFNYEVEKLELKLNEKVLAVMIPCNFTESFDQELVDKIKNQYNLILDLANTISNFSFTDFHSVLISFGSNKVLDSIAGGALISHDSIKYSKEIKRLLGKHFQMYYLKTLIFILTRKILNFKITKIIFKFLSFVFFPKIVNKDEKNLKFQKVSYFKANTSLLSVINVTLKKFTDLKPHNSEIHTYLKSSISPKFQIKNSKNATSCFFPIFINNPKKLFKDLKNKNQILSLDWSFSQIAPSSSNISSEIFNSDDFPNSKFNSDHLLLVPINNSVKIKSLEPIISLINKSNHV